MSKEQVYIRSQYSNSQVEVGIEALEMPNMEARFAMAMIEKWGCIQGTDGGEDSAGRAKTDLMPVDATVKRACNLAQTAFHEFKELGWLIDVPSKEEAEEIFRKAQDEKSS